MDVIRFLNFLHTFASAASEDLKTQAAARQDLKATVSRFESQLRDLMDAPAQPAADASASASNRTVASTVPDVPQPSKTINPLGFVAGGLSLEPAKPVQPVEVTEADKAAFWVNRTENFVQTRVGGSIVAPERKETPAEKNVLANIIAWQGEQMDPVQQVRIADIWARQGIDEPAAHPKILEDAQRIYDTSMCRKNLFAGYVADWEGDWRSQLAQSTRIASAVPKAGQNDFVAGGGKG